MSVLNAWSLPLKEFPVAQTVKNPPAMQETWVQSLCWENPVEESMATHSSILAWRIPWTEEPGGLYPQCRKESDMTERLTHTRAIKKMLILIKPVLPEIIF